ncbi:MAG: septation protein SpoVG family protein [Candidatus Omnitrophica bacterium]|nr:septation protein SpoVG family protein [Candidatus Omnitrophota bacterium]
MIEVARLHRFENNGSPLKAFADVVINQVLVKGVRIVEGKNGLFITMPQSQGKDGKWYPTTMLLDDGLKDELQEALLEAYNV